MILALLPVSLRSAGLDLAGAVHLLRREYAHIARASPMRMDDLGFKHHQVVAALPSEFSPRTALLCPYERPFAFKPF